MRPRVYYDRTTWVCAANGRVLYVRTHWREAIRDADRLATHRTRRQIARDIARIRAALTRMEAAR